jgi:MFS family permease
MASSTPDPRRWWALAIIAAAQFIVIMDTSIIGVALPEIQRALQFSQPDLSWVFNASVADLPTCMAPVASSWPASPSLAAPR